MHTQPLVTVICLCYNHEAFVIKALDSILSQTYNNIEILIADDASTDQSVEKIKQWCSHHPNIYFLENTKNQGNTKTFNQLFKKAKGKYILDLAADDALNQNCIEELVNAIIHTKYTNLALVYANIERIDESDKHIEYYYPINQKGMAIKTPPSGYIYTSLLAGKEKMCAVASLITTDVLRSLNGYDETLAYEDFDIWIRASKKYNVEYVDKILAKKRALSNSLSTHFFKKGNPLAKKINISTYKILCKAFNQNTFQEENRALLKRVHYEMVLNYKNQNYLLLLKFTMLKLKIQWVLFNWK